VAADTTGHTQAEAAVGRRSRDSAGWNPGQQRCRLDAARPVGADVEEWDRMIAVNLRGRSTAPAPPHLLTAPEDGRGLVADIVNVSSIAGRVAWSGYGAYNLKRFGVNGFIESMRQEVTRRDVCVGVIELGEVNTDSAPTTSRRFAAR